MPDRHYVSLDQFRAIAAAGGPAADRARDFTVLMPRVATVRQVGDAESRVLEFRISLPSVDREQDTIALDGWDFTDYRKNPVVLWAHDHYSPPIASARSVGVVDGAVRSVAEFTPQDLNAFGFMIYRMYAAGFLHAVSVGFQPVEWAYDETRRWGINYTKQVLLEYSACPVPAHPDALVVARSKGIDTTPMLAWAEQVLDESRASDLTHDQRRRLEALRASSSPRGRALILELSDLKTPPSSGSTAAAAAVRDQLARLRGLSAAAAKTGRVLSQANEDRIRAAIAQLEDVLAQLDSEPADVQTESGVLSVTCSPAEASLLSEAGIADAVAAFVAERIARLTGRVPDPEPTRATEAGEIDPALVAAIAPRAIADAVAHAINVQLGRVD